MSWMPYTKRNLLRFFSARFHVSQRSDLLIQSSTTWRSIRPNCLNNAHQYQQVASWSTDTKSKPITKKQPTNKQTNLASSGRISYYNNLHKRKPTKSKSALLCSGCGVEIITNKSHPSSQGMSTGPNTTRSNRQEKAAQYVDYAHHPSTLCHRCIQLQKGQIHAAYDALHDVDSKVFTSQLTNLFKRHKHSLCLVVVDASDPEFTCIRKLRNVIGSTQCILVLNKMDLLPRMNGRDVKAIVRQLCKPKGSVKYMEVYPVSAKSGRGLISLAEGILNNLSGRDVFIVGSANVGKSSLVTSLSSLMARSLHLKGKDYAIRKETLDNLNITLSHLPGTTLQSVRIPCFTSSLHALWDTPGLLQKHSVGYSLFPSHYMEPLVTPQKLGVPNVRDGTKVSVGKGESILIEAGWVGRRGFTLARLDVVEDGGGVLDAMAFVPECLRVRVVPTVNAPVEASMPREYIAQVQKRTGKLGSIDETKLTRPLVVYNGDGLGVSKDGHVSFDSKDARPNGWIDQDIVFASLGFIMLSHRKPYTVRPWVVQDSLFLKRPSLYPSNLKSLDSKDDAVEEGDVYDDTMSYYGKEFQEIRRRLRMAYSGQQPMDSEEKWRQR